MYESKDTVHFGAFSVDPNCFRLQCGDRNIQMRPKPFLVLHHLAENPDRLVTKNELLDRIWSGRCVGEAVIRACMREIRRALEDDAKSPRFIETVHTLGYRFIGKA